MLINRNAGWFVSLVALFPLQIFAAECAAPALGDVQGRPTVGLVLGGGGARGAAHIGVLRELERMRVPIDAIAGTSMGAIVGGLYAAGHSVAELEEIVETLDWQAAFQDKSSREQLRFRRKQDDAQYPVGFELGLNDGSLRLPKGAISGQKLGLILRDLTLEVPVDADFNELPIPYRAVAADLSTGAAHAMCRGDLAKAIRASMSAPGIFAPVTIDGRTLVDGGLGGNVPVDTMREMGVDIIIAVDVEFPLYSPDQLVSALDVSAQMLTILIRNQTQQQLATLTGDDVLITPDLGQFGSADFLHITEAVEPGAVAAAALESDLRRLSLEEVAYRRHLEARNSRSHTLPSEIGFVRVVNDGVFSNRVLESRLVSEAGDAINPARFARDAEALFALQTYEQVDYRLVKEGGETGLEFEGRRKTWGPNYLLFGLTLEDDFEGQTAFNVSARLTRTEINSLGAEWRTDAQVGTDPFLVSEFYQPLSFDANYFVAPRLSLQQSSFNVFSEDDSVARYRVSDALAGIDVGRELNRWGEFRIGLFRGVSSARVKVGDPGIPNVDDERGGVFARIAVDTLDDAQIPLNGLRATLQWVESSESLGADTDYSALLYDMSAVKTFGRHSFEFGAVFNTSIADDTLVQNFFPLGGFLRMSGLARGEIAGPHAGFARTVYYRRSGNTGGGLFDIPLYLGVSMEAGNVWQDRDDISGRDLMLNGSVFAGFDTYFGPLYIAAGIAEGGRSNFYLALGSPRQGLSIP